MLATFSSDELEPVGFHHAIQKKKCHDGKLFETVKAKMRKARAAVAGTVSEYDRI